MASVLTQELIESTVNSLPVQGRIMLRLLLLQYLDLTQEDIEYIANDRPDPRFQQGFKAPTRTISQETIQSIVDRLAQYRTQIRQKRERGWLQTECLRRKIAYTEQLCSLAEELLVSRFGMDPDAIQTLKKEAPRAVPKPAIRELDRKWEKDEITEEEYRRDRLCIEYQTHLRRLERDRKRLQIAENEYTKAGTSPLQDHEIGHIWGIPASTLAARKVKYLHQYVQTLQAKVKAAYPAAQQASTPPLDLWKETFAVLSCRLVERSVTTYDGLERTEAALLEKLRAFASGTLDEHLESPFWLSMLQHARPGAEYGYSPHSLFALQRLAAIQAEMDLSPDALEQELIARISPKPKLVVGAAEEEGKEEELKLSEEGEHVLRSLIGEDRGQVGGTRW